VASPLFAAWEFSVSGDTSPPSRYSLDHGVRTAGVAGDSAPPRQVPSAPSWIKVIGTTVRLWVRRRLLHLPDSARMGTSRRAAVGAAAAVVAVAAAIAVVGLISSSSAPAPIHQGRHAKASALTAAQRLAQAAAAAQTAANTRAAASWVAAQVSAKAVIGCDPATCAAILAAGYPSGGQVILQPGVSLPAAGGLVVVTPALRSQYGPQLMSAAPAVVAAFGTGSQAVQVRLVMSGGQAGYSASASSVIATRRAAGRRLIAAARVHVRSSARAALTAGLVDPRLLTVLHRIAAHHRLDIVRFGDAGPLADGSVPFRLGEIIVPSGKRRPHRVSALARMEKLLRSQPAGYRAALAIVRLRGGRYAMKIEFPAPSPY
jgi:hypothetical protein